MEEKIDAGSFSDGSLGHPSDLGSDLLEDDSSNDGRYRSPPDMVEGPRLMLNSVRRDGGGNKAIDDGPEVSSLTAAGRGLSASHNSCGRGDGASASSSNDRIDRIVKSYGGGAGGSMTRYTSTSTSSSKGSGKSINGSVHGKGISASAPSTSPGPKLHGILKKDGPPVGAFGRPGMGKRSSSFRVGMPKPLSRSNNTMSTRFILAPPNKTVRFRLESDKEQRPWFAMFEVLDPRLLFMVRWKSLCIVFLSISFFRLPIIMAFGAHGLVVDFMCDIYFLFDNMLALNTAILYKDRLITNRREIVMRYFSWETFRKGERWCFLVFVMEFVPFYVGIILTYLYSLPDWFLSVCAAFRARRMYDLLSYFHALEMRLDSDLRVLAVTKYGLVLFGGAHWFGCVWWAMARFSGFGDTCWVVQYLRLTGEPITSESFRSTSFNYLLSLYWGFTVLTGTMIQGYAPDNMQETILSVVSIFIQVLIFSFLLGILLHYIVKKDANQEKFNALMDKVERYAKMHDLPRRLESSIKLCFTFQHQKRIGQDEEILAAIPMTMRTKILAHRYKMVAANDIFRGCQEHFVTSILAVLRPKILIPGVTIFNRDDMTRETLFVEEGEVEVYAEDGAMPFKIVKPSETVFPVAGAIAFFLGIPQPYTHKASIKSHVKLLTLSKDDYEDIRDRYPESRDQLIDNIKAAVGLSGDGEMESLGGGTVVIDVNGGGRKGDDGGGGRGGGGRAGKNDELGAGGGGNPQQQHQQQQHQQQQRHQHQLQVQLQPQLQEQQQEAQAAILTTADGQTKDTKEAELRWKVALGLQKKLDDDLATMFNAIDEGDLEAVKLLLDKGFKANAADYDLRSGLHFAAAKGEDKIVELLIQRGADVHLRDRWERNALQDAIDNGHFTVTNMLASQGAELKLQNSAGRLCAAAFSDNLFELQRLVENGINCNAGDYDGRTALHLGACEGNNKVVEYLLLPMNKCNPGVSDRWGISPLFDAIKHGNLSVARILYENGARLSKGKAATFLCTAAANGDSSLLRMLFECGVDTNIGDYDYRYPIHLAAAEGEVISVEFLVYAHADISVKDRWGRTPLDDAITEGHLCCAKMLMSFGAEHTISVDATTQSKIEEVDLKEVREMVRVERTVQEQRKSVAKQLRDTVKWMATESETWLKTLEDRLKHLQRTTDRMVSDEDCDEFHLDTRAFLEQSDQSILVSERPERVPVPSNGNIQDSYMLSRFINESGRGRGGSSTSSSSSGGGEGEYGRGGVGSSRGGSKARPLKSMQHFFLKWNVIHSAIKLWKERLVDEPVNGAGTDEVPSIDKLALGAALRTLEVDFSDDELDRAFAACTNERSDCIRLGGSMGGVEEKYMPEEGGSGMVAAAALATGVKRKAPMLVSSEDVLMAMPVWSLIMRAHAQEDSDLSDIQEAVDVICEGYRLLTRHGNGKLGRAAWMIQKRESDMGEFTSVVDNVFLEQDVIDKETFFLTVARWAALRDEDAVFDGLGEGGGGGGAGEMGVAFGVKGEGRRGLEDLSVVSEGRLSRMADRDSYMRYNLHGGSIVGAHGPYGGLNNNDHHRHHHHIGGGREEGMVVAKETDMVPMVLERGRGGGSNLSLNGPLGTFPAQKLSRVGGHVRGVRERLKRAWKLWLVKRKLRASLLTSKGSSSTQLAMPDFERHFARFDLEHCGWLDRTRTELLLNRGFDVYLSREEWELVAESLEDKVVGKVDLATVERFWMELNGIAIKAPVNSALDVSIRGGKSLDLSQRAAKELAVLNAGGSKRLAAGVVIVERRSWSEALLFDSKGHFIALWRLVMTFNALYYFLSVPFMIAFLRDEILGEYRTSLYVAYAFDCLLFCDVFVKLNTSFLDTTCSVLVVNRQRIRNRYLTGGFFRDLIGLLPIDILVRYLGASGTLVTFMRLPKMLFCYRLVNFFRRRSLSSSSRLAADLQALLFSALGMIHILTCIWFFMTEGDPGNYQALSGYEDFGDYTNHPSGGGPFRLEYYFFCYMLLATLLSTQAIYDLVMGRVSEICFTIVILLLNLTAWAYLMGTISGLCVTADESIAQSHELMTAVSRFIQHNPMPPGVSEELKSYFNVNAQQKTQLSLTEQTEIYRNLPLSLQVEAARHISRDSLLSVEIFEKTSDYFLDSISTLLDMEIFGVGDYVYKADDICRSLYVVASGSVEVGKMNPETNEFEADEMAGPGSALGQLEFLFDVRYMNSARVSGADGVRVFRLGKEDFTRVIKLYPMDEDILYENLSRLADDKMETGSRAPSMAQSMSTHSLDMTVIAGDDLIEKAMDSIDKAQKRSKEQRIRSFCNAAAEGNMDILQRLLRSGIDVNGRDCNERTALMVASSAGNFELVKWLVSLGAEVNLQDKFGGSALSDAMHQNTPVHMEIMGFLSQRGAVLELEDAAGQLCQAAADGEQKKLARMLEMNVSPNVADYDQRTPLHLAASQGHLNCVKLLLNFWADVNPIDRMGGTPLSDAVRHGHIAIQAMLREHGGLLNMDPVELGTRACEAGSSGDLDNIRVLVDNGADINTGDYDGRTALHMATCYNRLSVIEYLVSIPSINVNPLDRLGQTPLDDAKREGLPAIVNILQARGGLSGTHPSLEDRMVEQKEKKARMQGAKLQQRLLAARLFDEWSSVQDELSRVYKYMSEYLPPLCKYINILSMTLRSRRTQSTIDRSPKPDLMETRLYFYNSFLAFLERRYKVNLESSMTLVEEMDDAGSFEDKVRIASLILERYLDAKSADRVHFHPMQVIEVRERFQAALKKQVFPADLFAAFRASVAEKMEELLSGYFESDFYYRACRQPNGFLWRVMKLSRLIYGMCDQTLEQVIDPFLALCDRDVLACVPHYSLMNRQAFRDDFVKLKSHITSLQPVLHIVGYKCKHDAMRESIKERREKHGGLAAMTGGAGGKYN
ncbi:potassium channel skor-like [Nannochloropsis oceanica]